MARDLVEIYRGGGGELRGEMLRSMLEGHGIEAHVASAGGMAAYPVNVGALGEFVILVGREQADEAADILRAELEGS